MIEESIALKADLSRLAHILRHSPNAARPWHNLLTGDHTWRRRCCGALPFEKVDRPFNANNRHAIERRINNIRPFANALRALPRVVRRRSLIAARAARTHRRVPCSEIAPLRL